MVSTQWKVYFCIILWRCPVSGFWKIQLARLLLNFTNLKCYSLKFRLPGFITPATFLHSIFVSALFLFSRPNVQGTLNTLVNWNSSLNNKFSLTVTLVVTLRKFFSLLVSVIYFKTYWGAYHWTGTLLGNTASFTIYDYPRFPNYRTFLFEKFSKSVL